MRRDNPSAARLPCAKGRRPPRSAVGRVEREVLCDLTLPAVAVIEQFVLVVEKLLARLRREFEVRAFDDGIDGAGLLAQPAVDAFDHVDVVARRAPGAVIATR